MFNLLEHIAGWMIRPTFSGVPPFYLTASSARRGWCAAALASLAFLCAGATACAQLSWTEKKIELSSDSTAPTLEARFHFIDSGVKPVDIVHVTSSCGCTSAKLEKRHFEPGQGGDIVVTYSRGSRTGLQTNLIAVDTGDQPPTMLTLLVHIPEVVRLDPPFVTWTRQEARTPKTILLKMVAPGKITALEVQSSDPAFSAQARATVPGREYRLVITPEDVSHFQRAVLGITYEVDGRDKKTFTSYATVQPDTP